MKLLVIGGSYFLGRVFVMQAAGKHDITVVNRGTWSLESLGVKQIKGDRRDDALWRQIEEDVDVIVDFCAYEKGDIARVLRNIRGTVKQYLFISTLDVYERGLGGMKTEDAPFETRVFPGEAGAYIAGKVALERELREVCGEMGIACTVLRPAFIYGPFNYAPRESAYIQLMVQNHALPHITDAEGTFQFVYVKDAAEAAIQCLLNPAAYGQAYNLCQDQTVTYEAFYEALCMAADVEAEELPVTAEAAQNMGIPLPFPVTAEESELSSNEKSKRELGVSYISFQEGMARTYRAFKGVYQSQP
ncbi:MAG TPA: hypothetical protein DCZ91_21025 [Lachnospiraceae bacterium]|nr:hypothetical protein [Lachnospiraceae bacterium]